VFAAGYGYYHFSGAKTIVQTTKAAKNKFSQATQSLKESAPEPNEALKWLRTTATSYAAFIPGAKAYVDSAFNDIEAIQQKHSKEVDEIVSNAYSELRDTTKGGLTIDTATKTWEVLQKYLSQLGDLAGDSFSEIIDNHPQLKEKVGGNLDQLKSMAKSYGPEAQDQLKQTFDQMKDVVKGGVSADSINKLRQIIQEKTEQVKKLGDEAWKKGMEQAKPYLEKNPKVKELVEKNTDFLKKGNATELLEKVKDSVQSGNTGSLEDYINSAKEKANQSGMSGELKKYMKMIPGGDQIIPKLGQLQEVAQKHGDDADKILKETYEEISQVLKKRIGEAEELANKAGKDAKK